jgi:predicted AlkP superfamily phosphohydrolase/phosphomutase
MLCLALLLAGLPHAARGRVVLVGIDGASWNVIDAAWSRGELPELAALAARGVTAELATVEPVNSPTVWTSIATGRSPGVHGVTDFQATRLTLRVPSVFERLARAGRRVGLLEYLVTWPPPELPGGFVVPGWLRHDDSVTPPDLWRRIGAEPWSVSYRGEETREDFLALSRREFAEKPGRWNRLAAAFDVEVGAVTFYTVDTLSHRFWNAAYPEQFAPSDRMQEPVPAAYRDAVASAMRGADRAVGEIAAALSPRDTLIVVSDHGFRADPHGVQNVWVPRFERSLARAGLDPARDGFHVVTRFGILILEVHEGPFEAREAVLERLLAAIDSWRSASGEPLFATDVIDVAERPPHARRSPWRRLRQWAIGVAVRHIYHMSTDRPGHAYVFSRPRDSRLAELWPDGGVVVGGEALRVDAAFHRDAFPGTHDPTAVFLAAGGPVAPRAERGRLSVLDVAPLLLQLAGAPLPDDLEGELPRWVLDPGWLAAQPPRTVPAADLPGLPPVLETLDPSADAELVEMLRRLGYVR